MLEIRDYIFIYIMGSAIIYSIMFMYKWNINGTVGNIIHNATRKQINRYKTISFILFPGFIFSIVCLLFIVIYDRMIDRIAKMIVNREIHKK